jgi:hypothetical protein
MRRNAILEGAIMVMLLIEAANAQTLTLMEALPLRAGPGNQYRILKTAPMGALLTAEPGGLRWTRIDYDGRSYYADTRQLNVASGAASMQEPEATDPACDYSYPYSGSNMFFDRPLAKLRHSDPIGVLFGFHSRNPC